MTQPPGAPQWPQQPPPQQHPWTSVPPPKRRGGILKMLGATFAVLVILGAIGSALDDSTEPTTPASSGAAKEPAGKAADEVEAPPARAGIGDPARDGKFEFVVRKVTKASTVGNEFANKKAQGVYRIITIQVTNIGDKPQTFFGENQRLLAGGKEFSADTEASFYLADADSALEEINPGNRITARVVFDLPAGAAPAAIELHDSVFSGGVVVSLR